MGFCKTPPFLEGAQLSQLSVATLTCTETHLESDSDQILTQANKIFSDFADNYTLTMLEQSFVSLELAFDFDFKLHLNFIFHRSSSMTTPSLRLTC